MSSILLPLLTAMLTALPAAGDEGPLNELRRIALEPTPGGARVRLDTAVAPVYTVFRLNDPDRLVVDVAHASTGKLRGHQDGVGPVSGVVVSQFVEGTTRVARLLIGLEGASKYDVRAEKDGLVVAVDGRAGDVEAVRQAQLPAAVSPARAEATERRPVGAPAERPTETDVVASRLDERPVARPATRLLGVRFRDDELRIVTDAEVAKFELLQLENPSRLAVDLYGIKGRARAPRVDDARVRAIRVGPGDGKVRVVLEAKGALPTYEAERRPDGVSVRLRAVSATRQLDAAELEIDGQRVALAPADESAPRATPEPPVVEVRRVDFVESPEGGEVRVQLSGRARFRVERPDGRSAVLTIDNARVRSGQERSLDTSDLGSPVKMVSVFGVPGPTRRARVVVAGDRAMDERVRPTDDGLAWSLAARSQDGELIVAEHRTAGLAAESADYAASAAPRRRWVGKKVSFEFKDIDLHNFLRIMAEISKRNIVVGDDVSGKVTVRLRNVPWDQALDLVLRTKQLGMEETGSIIRVAPLSKLEDEAKQRAERIKAMRGVAELAVQLVPVNYATAEQMSGRVKEVLSERGSVTTDSRTNTLIVRDLPQNMGKVRSLVASLDTQTPQVLIESRIVEAVATVRRAIGVQWGGQAVASAGTGNPTGLVFPNSVAVTGGAGAGNANGVSTPPNYAVSLPVGAGDGSGGALGMVFGSAGGALQLNLRLSALEAQGQVKTISAPKVTTLDNESAKISQGVSIPFSQVSAAGANTSFIEARLSLDVTPHITQDGSVLMKVKAENSQPDPANTGSNGQPAIQRKEASTNVLVKDGDTTVIGGIYVRIGSQNSAGLPFLSRIPVLGFFFRNNSELETKNEMLIFITPRILNRQAVASSS